MTNDDLSLYGIADELQALDDMLDSNGGEITQEWEAKQEWLIGLLIKKVDGCVGYMQKLKDQIAAAREQQERLQSFIKSKNNRIENFKHYIKLCMQKTGRTEFEGNLCKIDTTKGRESLEVADGAVDHLPMEFLEMKAVAKKDKLTAALRAGQTFEGVRIVRGEDSIRFGLKKESNKRKAKTNANNESNPEPEQPTEQSTGTCHP